MSYRDNPQGDKAFAIFVSYIFLCVIVVMTITALGWIDLHNPLYKAYYWLSTIFSLILVFNLTRGNAIGSLLVSFMTGWCIWPFLFFRFLVPRVDVQK